MRDVPLLDGAWELTSAGSVPGGTLANLQHVTPALEFAEDVPEPARLLLADAQTSGGLLLSVPEAEGEELLAKPRAVCRGPVAIIGHITGLGQGKIRV